MATTTTTFNTPFEAEPTTVIEQVSDFTDALRFANHPSPLTTDHS